MDHATRLQPVRVTRAGVVLGLALGGFADGILLHQVLQWHHMLTSVENQTVRTDIELNTLADGLFHGATWILAVLGLTLLWHARWEFAALVWGRAFVGALLIGAGLFNLVEGLIDHHLLGIHHVRTDVGNVLLWDLGFPALGLVLVIAGWLLRRSRPQLWVPASREEVLGDRHRP